MRKRYENMTNELQLWLESVSPLVEKNIAANGNTEKWLSALQTLAQSQECECFIENGKVVIAVGAYCIRPNSPANTERTGKYTGVCNTPLQNPQITAALRQFMPWRKGPWKILGVDIDTEWRSDFKWERLEKHFDFREKKILDIGCGNGYYAYRTALSGAKFVLGVDPSVYSFFQAQIAARLCPQIPVKILPLAQKDLPLNLPIFDIVFSMGVLYHHKNPKEHLSHIYDLLTDNGEIILETLIIDDEKFPDGLFPKGRYAKMRNVYEIPSVKRVGELLNSLNFKEIKLLDKCITTTEEQRKTEFMDFESLEDFLAPNDNSKTIEGYPAPTRAIFRAVK